MSAKFYDSQADRYVQSVSHNFPVNDLTFFILLNQIKEHCVDE
jgi:hypothetical protein